MKEMHTSVGTVASFSLVLALAIGVAHCSSVDGEEQAEGADDSALSQFEGVKWKKAKGARRLAISVCWENDSVTSVLPSVALLTKQLELVADDAAFLNAVRLLSEPEFAELMAIIGVTDPATLALFRDSRALTDVQFKAKLAANGITKSYLGLGAETEFNLHRYARLLARRALEKAGVDPYLVRTFDVSAQQAMVEAAIADTWQRAANIDFTGWKACGPAGENGRRNELRMRAIGTDIKVVGNLYFTRLPDPPRPNYMSSDPSDTRVSQQELATFEPAQQRSWAEFLRFDSISNSRVNGRFGRQLDGYPSGLMINLTLDQELALPEFASVRTMPGALQYWPARVVPGNCGTRKTSTADFAERCVKSVAVHEMGHALGLAHEQERLRYGLDFGGPDSIPDGGFGTRDPACASSQGITVIADNSPSYMTYTGKYDRNSIMNYCRDEAVFERDWDLTESDVRGIQRIYGRRK